MERVEAEQNVGPFFFKTKTYVQVHCRFLCQRWKLVIEIDGDSHRNKFHSDQTRERNLKNLGLHLLRFQDRDVKHDMRNVLKSIQTWIEQHETENTVGHPPQAKACWPPSKGDLAFPLPNRS